jgi:hypothetical protein
MICLGTDATIVPYTVGWSRQFIHNPDYHVHILPSILQAQASVLQYVKMLSANDFTKNECMNIQLMGETCTTYTLHLHLLKQAILNTPIKNYGGIKLHASINHIHTQILLFGSPKYYDTVRFEHQHAEDGVAAAVQTSRRRSSISSEMLITVLTICCTCN